MLRDEEMPPLPPSEKVMMKLTALQYTEVERYATDQLREYARAVEKAAYAAAIKAIEAIDSVGAVFYADAIRDLMQEQPK